MQELQDEPGREYGERQGKGDDRKYAILEQEIKGRWCVLVFSFTGLLFFSFLKKKYHKSESFKKPKTPTGDGQRELRGPTSMANPSEILDNEVEMKGNRGERDMAGKGEEGRLGWGYKEASRRRWKKSSLQRKSIRGWRFWKPKAFLRLGLRSHSNHSSL